ncbi:Flp pilus assembly pilin Flp [Ancylobacter sp. 3268]|nr:Flp pilus assembly pilin Flp [Ancylobacter sp. 3268]
MARRPQGTGLEYGLIAAALAVAIVTVVAGLGARYSERASTATSSPIVQTLR